MGQRNWETKKLGDVAKLKNGFAFKSTDYAENGIPVIRISDINENLVTTKNAKRVAMKEDYNGYQIEKNSILIAMSGATTGKFGIFKSNEKALQNQRVGKFVNDVKELSNKFLYYLLYNLKREIIKEAYGGAQPNISSKKIEAMKVEIPPLPTQHRIVEKIEELFSELDNGVANLKKAQQQLKTYRQAVLKDAFEGKLTKEWREQQTDLPTPEELLEQIKAEREAHRKRELAEWEEEVKQWEKNGKPGRKPTKPRKAKVLPPITEEQLEGLPKLPTEWRYTYLNDLGNLGRGKSKHRPRNDKKLFEDGSIPFIQTGEVKAARKFLRTYEDTYNEFGLSQSKLWPKETLCITIAANIAETAILDIKACFPDSIVGYSAYKDVIDKLYVFYFIQSIQRRLEAFAPATAQKNINLTTLENLLVPLCSKSEQEQIVQEIESRLSIVDQLEKTIEENLIKAEALRQSILKKAFNGELLNNE